MALDVLLWLIAVALIFLFGYEMGEWAEERRRDAEWWAERKRFDERLEGRDA